MMLTLRYNIALRFGEIYLNNGVIPLLTMARTMAIVGSIVG
jgi:hypothetical protein